MSKSNYLLDRIEGLNDEKNIEQTIVFIFAISFLFLVYANWNGIGYIFDSFDYWNAAQHLIDFLKRNEIENKIISRPPLFPIILSVFTFAGYSGQFILMFVQFSILSFFFWDLLKHNIREPMLQIIGFGLFVFSIPMHLVHSFIWSESTVMIWVILMLKIFASPKSNERFLALVLIGCLGVLTKNGFMLIAPGVSLILLLNEQNFKGVLKALSFGFALYLVHYGLTSMLTNMDVHQIISSVQMRRLGGNYLNVISGWLLPIKIPILIRGLFLSMLVVLGIYVCIVNKWFNHSLVRAASVFFVTYVFFRSYYSRLDYHESERYLSIVYPVFLLFVLMVIDLLYAKSKSKKSQKSKYLLYGGMGFWFGYTLLRTVYNDFFWHQTRILIE